MHVYLNYKHCGRYRRNLTPFNGKSKPQTFIQEIQIRTVINGVIFKYKFGDMKKQDLCHQKCIWSKYLGIVRVKFTPLNPKIILLPNKSYQLGSCKPLRFTIKKGHME